MDRRVFIPIGVAILAIGQLLLYLFGVASIVQNTLNGVVYATLVFGGLCAILAGYGVSIGPITWRAFLVATYLLLPVSFFLPVVTMDVGSYFYLPEPVFSLVVVLAVGLLVAMAIDIAFDSGRIVRIEPRTPDE